MANINIDVPDAVHKELKIKCAIEDITIKNFIIKTIKEEVERLEKKS